MALAYEADNRLRALAPVLDEHAEWFGRVMRWTFYPEDERSRKVLASPQSFNRWSTDRSLTDFIDPETLARLVALHNDLHRAAQTMVDESSGSGQKPGVKAMDSFVDLYDEFVMQLRRLEKDCILVDSGIDAMTGLRTTQAMVKDLDREMERRARRGRPFCIVMTRIDWYGRILEEQGKEAAARFCKLASDFIRKCIRSYDDAYRLENGEFVLSLKHTDISGAMSALARLRRIVQEEGPDIEITGEKHPMTMSYCVAEPMPGDNIVDLLDMLRRDLNEHSNKPDRALQYVEVSPLERYVKAIDPELVVEKEKSLQ